MRKPAGTRAAEKRESLDRILDAAARRIRAHGLDGAAIVPIMRDAGLTHGAFYAHFASKDELTAAAFQRAIATGREQWVTASGDAPWGARLTGLARRYLTRAHRDDPATGCGFAALASAAAHASPQFRAGFERELRASLSAICADGDDRLDDAIALMAICVGGLSLSRAVVDPDLSDRILHAAAHAATALADHQPRRPI